MLLRPQNRWSPGWEPPRWSTLMSGMTGTVHHHPFGALGSLRSPLISCPFLHLCCRRSPAHEQRPAVGRRLVAWFPGCSQSRGHICGAILLLPAGNAERGRREMCCRSPFWRCAQTRRSSLTHQLVVQLMRPWETPLWKWSRSL